MNSFTADSAISNSADQYNIQSNPNFRDAEFCSEKYHMAILGDLYSKYEDEPDFDCEFLYSFCEDHAEKENINELESQNDLGDKQWDAAIYDPYLESAYY